ncbi:cyclohexanone monooxygenase [Gymnopus androsaceus JB14]|uniref:Cyclohexanone monooxygenase n=1 Tax=Gymnopus androsaceus JB14 TaxID=1447944 RepID=A0A6A4H3D6_9AGAR|nr:cyclohexanone monooxygenase [Gymnopus androsaceus JB14]
MGDASAATYDHDLEVLVIGAGFSGIYQLYHYRKLGYSVKIFEAENDLGGVCLSRNRTTYPGIRVDMPVPMYEFSLEELWKDWWWTERYPGQKELFAYFAYVNEKLDVKKDVCFGTRVVEAYFNTDENRWIVKAENAMVSIIRRTGLEEKTIDFKGKRVGVIGTGASGVQISQTLGGMAEEHAPEKLIVFQRTPNLALPMRQTKLDRETQEKDKVHYPTLYRRRRQTTAGLHYDRFPKNFFDASPEERLLLLEHLWQTGGFSFLFANFQDVLTNRDANNEVYAFWRQKVWERLKNPDLREKLAPTVPPHPLGAKRSSLEQNYYDVFNNANVQLVDTLSCPIEEITPQGVKTADGVEYELDLIVLATGYRWAIHGVDGTTIKDKWKEGVYTYLGLTCAGFPNLFFVFGPHGPTAVCSGPTCAETEGEWIISCIKSLRENNMTRIEATREAEINWRQQVMDEAAARLFSTAKSWYMGANIPGKAVEILMYTGGAAKYTRICNEVAEKGYEGFIISKV